MTVANARITHGNTNRAFDKWLGCDSRANKQGYGRAMEGQPIPDDQFNVFNKHDLLFLFFEKRALSEAEKEELAPILDAIFCQLCESNTEYYNYVISWFASKVQNPVEKLRTMLWFCGAAGSGKGVLLNMLIGDGLFGRSYVQVSSLEKLTGMRVVYVRHLLIFVFTHMFIHIILIKMLLCRKLQRHARGQVLGDG